jgi:Ca2+-binding RTX toxin-like protein
MADFILTTIGGSLTGTSAADNMTFGIEVIDGVPFIATGSLSGAQGNDSFFTLDNPAALINGIQYAYGNEGNDNITLSNLFIAYGGKDNDIIQDLGGDAGASQQFFGNEGKDTIDAGNGNDYIEGNQEEDRIFAGAGNDFVHGGKGDDIIYGDQYLSGVIGTGFDTIYGNEGNDSILGQGGGDLIWGGQDKDTVIGGTGSDTIYGNEADDTIDGGADSDFLQGGKGNDTIDGGGSQTNGVPGDTIIGAEGADTLSTGDVGPLNIDPNLITSNAQYDDLFRYDYGASANVGSANVDTITGFQNAPALPTNTRTDKLSFAVGADAVLAGLNFTTGTTYDVNRTVGGATNPAVGPFVPGGPGATTYDGVFGIINNFFVGFGQGPEASTNDQLQVFNFTITYKGAATSFLYINNGNNAVDSANDMLIQGVNVVDGFNGTTGVAAAVSDIIFA